MILQGQGVYYAFQKERNKAAITKNRKEEAEMPYVILGFMATAVAGIIFSQTGSKDD